MAKFGIGVLVVIAIAGIVLATLQRGPPADGPVAADPTQPASGPMTEASASATAAEGEGAANQFVFAPESTQPSSAATAKLIRLADKANTDKQLLTILGRVDPRSAGADQRRQLVRSRAIAVRGVLEANGVPLSRMETRIEEPGYGLVSPKEANQVEVNPR